MAFQAYFPFRFFGFPASRIAIAMLWSCGFPSCLIVRMLEEIPFFDFALAPLRRGMVHIIQREDRPLQIVGAIQRLLIGVLQPVSKRKVSAVKRRAILRDARIGPPQQIGADGFDNRAHRVGHVLRLCVTASDHLYRQRPLRITHGAILPAPFL